MASIKPILRPQHLRGVFSYASTSIPHALRLRAPTTQNGGSTRTASTSAPTPVPKPPQIPSPTPLVPDVATFLSVIGRDLKQHASKIPDWESLFTLTSEQLRELGIEPPRTRRYLIRWRQRFRRGQYGVGGDLRHVEDGVAQLRILEADHAADPTQTPRKCVVNTPAGRPAASCKVTELSRVKGYHVEGARTIVGPYAVPLKNGEGAQITVTDGMWEDRRGHKIDGGERRRTEVRYKRRIAERREARERGEL